MTEFELKSKVREFYKRPLTLDKALKLFKMEYGYTPEIENDTQIISINIPPNAPDIATKENLAYMKKLQESGTVNMFASINRISLDLIIDTKSAQELLLFYMKNYNLIYFPETLI